MKTPEELQAEMIQALDVGNETALEKAAMAIAEQAAEDFPALHSCLNMLGYHNRTALINRLMAHAWPQVQSTAAYSTPAVNAYASRASDHLIFEFLRQQPQQAGVSPALLNRLESYFPVDEERLASYLELLRGHVGRRWSREDFRELTMPNLSGLLVEFLGYAYYHERIAHSRAYLARELLSRYLLDRQAGNFYPREDVAELLRSGRRPRTRQWEPTHPLCPDALTLEKFLEVTLQTVHPQPYAAVALFELLPLWLRFLGIRGLITEAQGQQTKEELQPVAGWLRRQLASHPDRALHRVHNWA